MKCADSRGQHNGNGVIEDALSEHKHVENRVDVQRGEDGERRDRVDGRNERAEREALHRRQLVHDVALPQKTPRVTVQLPHC